MMSSFQFFIMKRVIIFNDKDNFDGSLNIINKSLPKGEKRFWDYEIYLPFLFKKLCELEGFKEEDLNLIKTFFYTGKYNSKLVSQLKWNCSKEILELDKIITKEKNLLKEIEKHKIDDVLATKIKEHVELNIRTFEEKKEIYQNKIEKQIRNFKGQQGFIDKINKNPSIELRTTPLKQGGCEVYQKGVDGKIVTDLVNLAHTNSYDVAFILGGDTDYIEAIKLVKDSLSKIVVIVACYAPETDGGTNVSDLRGECNYFMNLHEYRDELVSLSEKRRIRE